MTTPRVNLTGMTFFNWWDNTPRASYMLFATIYGDTIMGVSSPPATFSFFTRYLREEEE